MVGRLVMIILILMILIIIAIIILAGLGGGQAGQGQVVAELEYCVSVRPTKGPPKAHQRPTSPCQSFLSGWALAKAVQTSPIMVSPLPGLDLPPPLYRPKPPPHCWSPYWA